MNIGACMWRKERRHEALRCLHRRFHRRYGRCPLCQNELRGEASPAAFPAQQIYLRPRRLAVEIITFVTGAILLLHGFFSYLFSWPIPIASASAAALIISVLFINSAILHVPRPLRLMFRYSISCWRLRWSGLWRR